jgi:hypothetical protein
MKKVVSIQDLGRVDGIQAITEANVILAVDTKNQHDLVVFGRETLAKAVNGEHDGDLKLLVVELDTSSDELARLKALIIYLRGDPNLGRV